MIDDQVRRALGEGNRTFRIARQCDIPTAHARAILRRLERDGLVYKDQYLSAPNDMYWRPCGAPMVSSLPNTQEGRG